MLKSSSFNFYCNCFCLS
ncbi:MAG: hypothetical protein E7286_03400 [Lachnospiraceae bacterium]|nr:hypothetical protein [Lachnospiraceae bacterium]